jgi:hypothetical protein
LRKQLQGSVTIENCSLIRIPKELAEKLGLRDKKWVTLHWDREKKIMGIHAFNSKIARRPSIRHSQHSSSIPALGFFRYFDISISKSHRFRCWRSKKMVMIDISAPNPPGRPLKQVHLTHDNRNAQRRNAEHYF